MVLFKFEVPRANAILVASASNVASSGTWVVVVDHFLVGEGVERKSQ